MGIVDTSIFRDAHISLEASAAILHQLNAKGALPNDLRWVIDHPPLAEQIADLIINSRDTLIRQYTMRMAVNNLGLSARILSCLKKHGITIVEQLLNYSRDELKGLHGIGGDTFAKIETSLHGWSLNLRQ